MVIIRFMVLFIIISLFWVGNECHSQNPDKNKNAENKKDKKKKDIGVTREVVAEGVGFSPDNALKNAFRNAVRQVTGTLVDDKTLVKNERLIEEKILSSPTDFLISHSEIDGSKKFEMKLHRIKIKAVVDAKPIAEKLKSNSIAVAESKGPIDSTKDTANTNKNTKTKKESTFIAEGSGRSPEEALRSAYRNAIYQVVGAVVDSDTIVKNDSLIEDKILTYSNGYVTGHKVVSKSNKDGIHSIKILAEVKVTGVIEKISTSNISLASFDGQSVGDKIMDEIQKKAVEDAVKAKSAKEGAELLVKKIKNFNRGLLKIENKIDYKNIEIIEKEAHLNCDISFEVDKQLYAQLKTDLRVALGKLADKRKEISFDCKSFGNQRVLSSLGVNYAIPDYLELKSENNQYALENDVENLLDLLEGTKNDIIPSGGMGVVLTNSYTSNMKTNNCDFFLLNKKFHDEFLKVIDDIKADLIRCKISLLDKNNESIIFKEFKIPSFVVIKNEGDVGCFFVSNHFVYFDQKHFYHSPKIISTLTFVLDPRDVAKIKSAKVEFVDD